MILPRPILALSIVIYALHYTTNSARVERNYLKEESKKNLCDLGLDIDRPPFTKDKALDLSNCAGEDFLDMHRKMIPMFNLQ